MTDTRSRFAIDLDEIERQLQQGASAPPAPSRSDPSRGDPLAELARIVGQNDPFRDLLAAESAGRASTSPGTRHAYPEAEPPRGQAVQAPAFDDHFAHQAYADPTSAHPTYADAHHHASEEHGHETYAPAPARRSRRGMMLAGAAVGTLVLGVGGFAATKIGRGGPTGGEPPVVKAEAGPVKVQPQNPGGVEIPNQNRQIYEKAPVQTAQTKVVNREEQPVDVRQAARAMQPAAAPAMPPPSSPLATAPTTAAIVPAAPPVGATAALGEPRRVRTVSVRPDGSIAAAEQTGSAKATPSTAPTMPVSVSGGPTSTASTPAAQPKPKPPVAVPPVTAQSATPAAPVRPPAAEAPPAAKTPQRLASVEPSATTPEVAAPTGGFSVQLAVRPSEKEARSAFQQFQQRFPDDLGSKPALIRKAEVNGSTIYRVRVGPLGKDDATSLCTRLQSAGGQCFVAKN